MKSTDSLVSRSLAWVGAGAAIFFAALATLPTPPDPENFAPGIPQESRSGRMGTS